MKKLSLLLFLISTTAQAQFFSNLSGYGAAAPQTCPDTDVPTYMSGVLVCGAGGGGGGGGTVTSVSGVNANGLSFSISNPTTTPAITLSTTVTGLVKANGTSFSAAISGTDYAPATSGVAILKGNGSGGFSNAVAGTDYQAPLTFGNLTDVGTDGITVTSGAGSVIGAGTSLAQHVADTTHNGYLLSADWNTFNGKQAALTPGSISTSTTGVTVGSGASSTVGPNVTVDVQTASGTQPGLLSSADWNTFNGKQSALTFGNLTSPTTGVSITGGTGAVIGAGAAVSIQSASGTQPGLLLSADWNTFNGKQNAITTGTTLQYLRGDLSLATLDTSVVPENGNLYFTNARARAALSVDGAPDPLAYNSATGVFSMPAAATAQNGYLASADWNTFNGKQPAGNYITALTGDGAAAGPGSASLTIANIINRVYVDFADGNDGTGTGSAFRPWKTLQHACSNITPTINVPIAIYLSGGNNDGDAAPITCPPNIAIYSDYEIQISQNFSITGGAANDTATFENLTFVGTFTWVRSDATAISLTLINTGFFGAFDFEQDGSGITQSFLLGSGANTSFDGGITLELGEAILQNVGLITGSVTYKDSGSAYFYLSGSDLYAANFSLNGGLIANFYGDFPEGGSTIVGTTTGSGTPAITSDNGSLPPPASITGAYTLAYNAIAPYTGYTPTTPGNWSPSPTTVLGALDQLATRVPVAGSVSSVTASAPLSSSGGLTPNITITQAATAASGYLSAADWNTFNSKQAALTIGNLTDVGTDGITVTSGAGSVIGAGTSLSQHVADTTHNGYLSSVDWNTFNSAAGGGITSLTGDVTGTGPGATATTIAANVVSNTKLAQMPTLTLKGNNTGGTANAADLTVSQVNTMLGTVVSASAPLVDTAGNLTFTELLPAATESVYVSKAGNDGTGNGSYSRPFLTIGKALTFLGTATCNSVNTCIVHIDSGSYNETGLQIPPWVFLAGSAQQPTKIDDSSGAISITPTGFNAGSQRIGLININTVSGTGLTVDFQAAGGAGSDQVYVDNCQIVGPVTIRGRGSDATTWTNTKLFGTYTSQCGQDYFMGGYFANSFTYNTTGVTSTACSPEFVGTQFFSGASFTSSGAGNTATPSLIASQVTGTLTSDQATTTVSADSVSFSSATLSQTNGGIIAYLESGKYVGYSPATPANWSPSPAQMASALDQLASRVPVAGAVSTVSVASANGLAGSSSGGTTPTLTLSTSVTGVVKGNGTSFSAATSGSDYSAGTAALATGILKSTTATGALSIAVAGDFPILNQNTTGSAASLSAASALPNGTTATTQSALDNSTKVATTAYVDSAVAATSINVVTKTTTYTAVVKDVVRCDATGGGFTITLPAAASSVNGIIRTAKVDNSANICTIGPTGGDTIQYQSSQSLTAQGNSVTWISNGVNGWESF